MSSNVNDYIKPTDYGYVRKDINRILSLIHDLVAVEPEQEGIKERIMFTPHVKLRTTDVIFGSPNLLDTDVREKQTWNWRRKKPTSVYSYDMVHTTSGALTFPVSDTWYGGRCDSDGTGYITITDNDRLDITDSITICMHLYLPASAGGFVLLEKVNEYRLRVVNTNTIEWAVYSGGAYKTACTYTYTVNTKFKLVATYKSTSSGQKLYIDGSLVDSDSETGALTPTSNHLCILATSGGSNIAKNGTRIAFFGLLHGEADSTWISNYGNGIYDTSGSMPEITTINFIGSEVVTPDAESGLFMSP